MTNNEIELKVFEVLQQYVTSGNAHKQLLNIIQNENIKYKEVDSKNINFIGALTTANNGQLYIMVNKNIENIGRKNFTIAHELGHYFLNHQLKTNAFYCFDNEILEEGFLQDNIENEANYFATCLLMPEGKVESAFKALLKNARKYQSSEFLHITNSTYGIWCGIRDTLTKRYGVSEQALRYRLKSLHLIDFDKYM